MPEPNAPTAPPDPPANEMAARLRRLERKLDVLLIVASVALFWPLVSAALGVVWWLAAVVVVVGLAALAYFLFRDRLPKSVRRGVDAAARRGMTSLAGRGEAAS